MELLTNTDEGVNGAVVSALLCLDHATQAELAKRLGISEASVSRRINGKLGWSAKEIGRIAKHLRVPVDTFYMSTEEAIERLRTPVGPDDRSPVRWAPGDSNPQPAEVRSDLATVVELYGIPA